MTNRHWGAMRRKERVAVLSRRAHLDPMRDQLLNSGKQALYEILAEAVKNTANLPVERE